MAENSYTADRRLYLDKDGKLVEADNPARATLLVAKGGKLSAEDAAKYGLTGTAPEEKAQIAPPANKAQAKAPANKAQPAPDATKAAQGLAEAEGVDLGEVEGSGKDGRIILADVEGAVKE